jgi:hypothetical protein
MTGSDSHKMIRIERPEAILVTMSKANIFEHGNHKRLDECLKVIDRFLNITYNEGKYRDEATWWYRIGPNFPKFKPLYIYFVMNNQIRWRFNFVEFQDHPDGKEFYQANGSVRVISGKFIICCGPAIKALEDIPRKGFQGFRYSPIIY